MPQLIRGLVTALAPGSGAGKDMEAGGGQLPDAAQRVPH